MTAGQRGDDGETGGAERERDLVPAGGPVHRDVGEDEGLGVGAAGESDAGCLPDGAVHAVGADGVAGAQGLPGAHGERHAVLVLDDGADLVRPVHVLAERPQPGQQHASVSHCGTIRV